MTTPPLGTTPWSRATTSAASAETPAAVLESTYCRAVEVVLARHGETEWSAAMRHTGRTDVPLTERGERQARAVGEALRGSQFRLVLSSPLRRALETARL